MKKIIPIFAGICVLFAASCSKIDNYDAPSATLSGQVIDKSTGKPFQTDQPNGFRIRYKELSTKYPNAQYYYFWGKSDGTFNNSKIFEGQYEVCPVEGAFYTPDPKQVGIPGAITFEVTPYLTISGDNVSFNASTKKLTASFKVGCPSGSDAVPRTAFVAVSWNPSVGYFVHGTNGTGALETRNISAEDLDTTLSFEIDLSSLPSGHDWYVRMGCSSNLNTSRYNYSGVHTFTY